MKKTLCTLLSVLLALLVCAVPVLAETELTDEELYAEIDRELHNDRVRGELYFRIADDAHIEELKQALIDMGLPSDFDNLYLYKGIFEDQPDHWEYGFYTVTVPEEIIREVYFQMEHCDAIKRVFPNYVEYPDWIPHSVGDVNTDYRFDAKDYMLAKRAVLGTLGDIRIDEDLADVNYDGRLDARDYMLIKRAVLGTAEISDRPNPKDMNAKQFAHWLDDVTPYEKPPYKLFLYLKKGVTAEQVRDIVGMELPTLFCSTDYYPDCAMWTVLEVGDEDFRTVMTNVIFSDLVDDWSLQNEAILTY